MSLYSDYSFMQGYSVSSYSNTDYGGSSPAALDTIQAINSLFSSTGTVNISEYGPNNLLVNSAGQSPAFGLDTLDTSLSSLAGSFGLRLDQNSSLYQLDEAYTPEPLNSEAAEDLVKNLAVVDNYHSKLSGFTGSIFGNTFPYSQGGEEDLGIDPLALKGLTAVKFAADADSGSKVPVDPTSLFSTDENTSAFTITDTARSYVASALNDLQKWKSDRGGTANDTFTFMGEAGKNTDKLVYDTFSRFAAANSEIVTLDNNGNLVATPGHEEEAKQKLGRWVTFVRTADSLRAAAGRDIHIQVDLGAGFTKAVVGQAMQDSFTDVAPAEAVDRFSTTIKTGASAQLQSLASKTIDDLGTDPDPFSAATRLQETQLRHKVELTFDSNTDTVTIRPTLQSGPDGVSPWIDPTLRARLAGSISENGANRLKLVTEAASRIAELRVQTGIPNSRKAQVTGLAGNPGYDGVAQVSVQQFREGQAKIAAFEAENHWLQDVVTSDGRRLTYSILGSDLLGATIDSGLYRVSVYDHSTKETTKEALTVAELAPVATEFARLVDTRIQLEKQQNQLVGDIVQQVDTGFFYDENAFGEKKYHWDAIIALLTGIAGAATAGGSLWAQIDTARKGRHWQERMAAQEHEWAVELQRLANEGNLAVANARAAESTGAAVGGSSGARIRVNTHAN